MKEISLTITGDEHDMGGFTVRRSLPHADKDMVGPFVFFDHLGPAHFKPGEGIDVRPHPHIGLSTVTYVFEGEITHRDSLDNLQVIRPGAVNWMTAGKGIVHSERTGDDERARQSTLHAIQIWVALPVEAEETEPEFFHYPEEDLPEWREGGCQMRLILGEFRERQSPVKVYSDMFYVDFDTHQATNISLPERPGEERALYVASGPIEVAGKSYHAGQLLVLRPTGNVSVILGKTSRVLYFGGKPFPEKRFKHWNFVSSSRERISRARDDWEAQRFGKVPGENEYIPLPKIRVKSG